MEEFVVGALPHLLCGIIIGFLIFYSGVGGGVLVIPVIVAFFGLPLSVAIGTASVYATLTKVMAGIEHIRIRNVSGRLAVIISLSAIPGVLITAAAVNYYSNVAESAPRMQEILRYVVAMVIAFSLLAAQFKPKSAAVSSLPLLIAAGFFIGLVMGATGIGGGVLIVPALFLLSAESPKRVVGSSVIIALALSLVTALVYAKGGQINYPMALTMSAGSLLAIPFASRMLRRSSDKTVRIMLTVLIVIALLLVLWK